MKQFFKNKFFYIISVITLLVTIVPMIFSSMGLTFVFRDAVGVLLTPMQKVFQYAAQAADGFAAYFYRFDELVEENNALREEIAELRTQIYDSSEREEMYAWLSDFLELKMGHNDYKFLSASVTGRESGNYSRILTLDVGSGAGVELHMPVITSEGIVGQITEVGYNWSKVTTIVEPNSSVGAYVERNNDAGIARGVFELSADGLCLLSYLPADSTVREGDRILSTGYGSVYPRDLVVGYVDSVETNPYTRSLDVRVRCAVDFSSLAQVMIITDFDAVAIDASDAVR
ncbi:MAG: rod shape-determining protein MreC [Clostridia bacterium]|nr:rod shape-determining protein MreC [Clostridia bacterium]